MNTIPSGPEWLDYLAAQLGTDKWVVAPRLTQRLKDKGYTLALTQARYTALQDAYNALQATGKAERIALALYWRDTRPPAVLRALDPEAWAERIQIIHTALAAEGLL